MGSTSGRIHPRLLSLLLLGTILGFLMVTPIGARLSLRAAAITPLRSANVDWGAIEGSWIQGIRCGPVQIANVAGLPPGSRVTIEQVLIRPFAVLSQFKALIVKNAVFSLPDSPPAVTARQISWQFSDGVQFQQVDINADQKLRDWIKQRRSTGGWLSRIMRVSVDTLNVQQLSWTKRLTAHSFHRRPGQDYVAVGVAVEDPKSLPAGSRVDIATARLSAFKLDGIQLLEHGIAQLPNSAPVLFEGKREGKALQLKAVADWLDLRDVPGAGALRKRGQPPGGIASKVNLRGEWAADTLSIGGEVFFHEAVISEWALQNCDAQLSLRLLKKPVGMRPIGAYLSCKGGRVATVQGAAFIHDAAMDWPDEDPAPHIEAVLTDLSGTGLPYLPEETWLKIQQVRIRGSVERPLVGDRINIDLFNGRLWLPRSDTLFFSGYCHSGVLDVRLYAKSLDVRDLMETFSRGAAKKRWSGRLAEFDGYLEGTLTVPQLSGQFQIESFTTRLFSINGSRGVLHLRTQKGEDRRLVSGEVRVEGGTASTQTTMIELEPSGLVFIGDPSAPVLGVKGQAIVQGTRINLTAKGPLNQPDLKLSSDPPLPQDRLLLMVATGKNWEGAAQGLSQGSIPADMAKDFIDYFVFGGSGNLLARHLGISETNLLYDPERNRFGAQATIADRFKIQLEAEPAHRAETGSSTQIAGPEQPPLQAYKIGAAYKLTPDTQIGIEREIESSTQRSSATNALGTGQSSHSDETILFKWKQRF